MSKWEYKVVIITGVESVIEAELNELGDLGWELMSRWNYRYAFKRPVAE